MSFLAPIWLFALLPWAAFAVWTWVGRRRRQWVPFLALWEAPEELRRPKKGVEPPPVGLILVLVAMLLGVVAMGRPVWRSPTDRGRVTIIVDRGASMSAVVGGKARFAGLAEEASKEVVDRLGLGGVDLIDVVEGKSVSTDRSGWAGLVAGWKRTAVDTSAAVRATVREESGRGRPTIVLTDKDLGLSNDQLVQVRPRREVRNAGIAALAERPGQVMVTLRATEAMNRTVRLRSGNAAVTQEVKLTVGEEKNVFLDLKATADTIEATLEGKDEFDGDDVAWLVRGRSWPTIESRTGMSDELRRMVEVYGRHRPAGEGAGRVVVARPGDLKGEEAGVVLAPTTPPESPRGAVSASNHPVVAGVDWGGVSRGVALSPAPGEGWTKVAWIGDRTIVAVRDEGPARQVWVGFESSEVARTPGFVVFWTNVFDWLGGGGEGAFAATDLRDVEGKRIAPARLAEDQDPAHWPGVFETGAGKMAANAGVVTFGAGGEEDSAARLAGLKLVGGREIPLAPGLAMAALVCLVGAAGVWAKRRSTQPATPGHLGVEVVEHVETMMGAEGVVRRRTFDE